MLSSCTISGTHDNPILRKLNGGWMDGATDRWTRVSFQNVVWLTSSAQCNEKINFKGLVDQNLRVENTDHAKGNGYNLKLYSPSLWMGFNCLKATEPLRGGSLRFTTKFQKFLVLTWLISQGWKAKSTLEPPSGFQHETPGLGIQRLNQ